MTNIEKLLSLSSDALATMPRGYPNCLADYFLGNELFQLLIRKNGFYAFESTLHVFPIASDPGCGLEGWNSESLWRYEYQDLANGLLFFAEDALQDQFCLSSKGGGVFRFRVETGRVTRMADSIENWASVILSDPGTETRSTLLHEWQVKHGTLPPGQRLMPKTPFFMGGQYITENLWAGSPLEGMRLKGDIAVQTRDIPDGGKVRLVIAPKPEK